jgi:hypothetical protein
MHLPIFSVISVCPIHKPIAALTEPITEPSQAKELRTSKDVNCGFSKVRD